MVNGTTTGIIIMLAITFILRPYFYSRLIFLYAAMGKMTVSIKAMGT